MKRFFTLSALGIIVGLAYLLGWSNVFPVKSIEIAEKDEAIIEELQARLDQPPAALVIGEPIARVDKREITSRLRTIIWVDRVEVRRSFTSGKVSISVDPRTAIAQLDSRWSANPGELGFLGRDLKFFFVARSEVAKAAQSGDADWLSLPSLYLSSAETALIEDSARLMEAITKNGAEVRNLRAASRDALKARIRYQDRELDISWGSVNELELKFEVLDRLLSLKANRNIKQIDLSSPTSPIVSSNR
ncbi:MAG: hypothetical protein RLZZ12_172 [Actinomycetota bacterium]|jgi:cell division septal protein FtsQ